MGRQSLTDFMMADIISAGIREHGLNMIVGILTQFDVSQGVNLSLDQRHEIVDLIREETFVKTGR